MFDIKTTAGDMVDELALKHLGDESYSPAILEANPGLSDFGEVLPAGLTVTIPDVAPLKQVTTIKLWD